MGPRDRLALPERLALQAPLENKEILALRQTQARLRQTDQLGLLPQSPDRLGHPDRLAQVDRLDTLAQVDRLDTLAQVGRLDTLAQVDRLDTLAQVDPPAVLGQIVLSWDRPAKQVHMALKILYFQSQVAPTNPPSSKAFQPTSFLGILSKTSQSPRQSVGSGSRFLILIGMGALGIIVCLIRNDA